MYHSALLSSVTTLAIFTLSFSLIVFVYDRTLVPLYGTGPTSYLLGTVLLGVMLISAMLPFHMSRLHNIFYVAVGLMITPKATYWVGVLTARWRLPVFGPAITHAVVLGPLGFLLVTLLLREGLLGVNHPRRPRSWLLRLAIASLSWCSTIQLSRRLWPHIAPLRQISDSQICLSLAFCLCSVWTMAYFDAEPLQKPANQKTSMLRPSVIAFVALVMFGWFAWPVLSSPILPHPLPAPYAHPDYPLRILSAVESVTGLIVVAEALPPDARIGDTKVHSMRYMRASHSLLGGVWMHDNVRVLDNQQPIPDSYGTYLGDSIYAAFVLQEVVRLVEGRQSMQEGLIIGLGTGISTTALNRHGIATTIIEIDPAVYSAARQYFGLPDPGAGRVFLEDARAWVARQKSADTGARFDFVIHDCFSGGAVPEHIYTVEFWRDLQTLMKPDGIVVLNYGGIANSESSRFILHTLMEFFGQCRAFHDYSKDLTVDMYQTTFVNMAIFCTRSLQPLTFREARKPDYLGSPLRKHILGSLGEHEVNISDILEAGDASGRYVLSDKHNPLGKLQEAQGYHHWLLMRQVLPDWHWETF